MAASVTAHLVSEVEAGAIYAWAESDDGYSGWLLFSPPRALFGECNGAGALDPAGMSLDLEAQELTNRRPELWRPFVQASHGVWNAYRNGGGTTLPLKVSRTFY